MTSVLDARKRKLTPEEINLTEVSLPGTTELGPDELRALGYVIRIGENDESEAAYRSDPCKFPSLNSSTAKVIVRECPEDGWRMHPRGGAVRREATAATDDGNLFDRLLTGRLDYAAPDKPSSWTRDNKSKKTVDTVYYSDWNGFRVVDADAWTTKIAQEVRDHGREKGLIPILQHKLEEAVSTASEMRARLELAGLNLLEGRQQVPIYWVEFADDGTPVQCRGLIDQLLVRGADYLIRDLKSCESLQRRTFARQAYGYGYLTQAAAYTSGVERITGEFGRVQFEWALVRKGVMPAAARRKPTGELLAIGQAEWRFAINTWAKCLREGLFPGYELAGVEYVHAEPWMLAQAEELEMSLEGEE